MKEKKHYVICDYLKITAFSLLMLLRWPALVRAQGQANSQQQAIPKIPAIPFDKIGIITTKLTTRFYALIPYRDMILDVRGHVLTLIAGGKTRQEVLAAKLTAPYDNKVPGGTTPLPAGLGTSADRFVGALYDECKKQTL